VPSGTPATRVSCKGKASEEGEKDVGKHKFVDDRVNRHRDSSKKRWSLKCREEDV